MYQDYQNLKDAIKAAQDRLKNLELYINKLYERKGV